MERSKALKIAGCIPPTEPSIKTTNFIQRSLLAHKSFAAPETELDISYPFNTTKVWKRARKSSTKCNFGTYTDIGPVSNTSGLTPQTFNTQG